MNDIPVHRLMLIERDMKARLGKESGEDPRTNRNEELLRGTALECDMNIKNIRFKK